VIRKPLDTTATLAREPEGGLTAEQTDPLGECRTIWWGGPHANRYLSAANGNNGRWGAGSRENFGSVGKIQRRRGGRVASRTRGQSLANLEIEFFRSGHVRGQAEAAAMADRSDIQEKSMAAPRIQRGGPLLFCLRRGGHLTKAGCGGAPQLGRLVIRFGRPTGAILVQAEWPQW